MDTEAYDRVQTAYETLTSPEKRAEYDAELKKTEPEPNVIAEPAPAPTSTPDASTGNRVGTVPLRRNVSPINADVLGADTTRAFKPTVCPICSHQNSVGDVYCTECGFLLSTTPGALATATAGVDYAVTPRLENAAGHIYQIKPGLNRVGRENADILILDKVVSRYHALLVFDEERHLFSVEDAGSSNGTKINETVLSPRSSHALNNGDEISFGTAKFLLVTGEPAIKAEKGQPDDERTTEIEISLPPTAMIPMAKLTLQRGRGPQEVLLIPGTISIGRLPDNQISLPGDRYASGHHAQIVVEERTFRLIDVGSTNGSFLNGLRLTTNESIAMSDGDEIMIGSTVFQFQKVGKSQPPSQRAAQAAEEEPSETPAPPVESLDDSNPDAPDGPLTEFH
jgi:pSer/pThr/pTyr-binding forkhead associated (FHA) protein